MLFLVILVHGEPRCPTSLLVIRDQITTKAIEEVYP